MHLLLPVSSAFLAASGLTLAACSGSPSSTSSPDASIGGDSGGTVDSSGTLDSSSPDATTGDAGLGPDTASDAAEDAGAPIDAAEASVPTVYNDLDAAADWTTFDIQSLEGGAGGGFQGGTFDGRYVYLAPAGAGGGGAPLAIQYDTSASFAKSASWTSFNTTKVNPKATGFWGAAFDGRYVYYAPRTTVAAQFDTKAPFDVTTSWSAFDTSVLTPTPYQSWGAVFDGTYVYFVGSILTRYDTTQGQSGFTVPSSWTTFDTSLASLDTQDTFAGGVFDGRYLYLVSSYKSSVALCYDTTAAAFNATAAWAKFDTSTLNAAAKAFAGGSFDGRYVYYVPDDGSVTVRYDTKGSGFGAAASWSSFDVATVTPSYTNLAYGNFDGRYAIMTGYVDLLVRFDTTETMFDAAAAWSEILPDHVTSQGDIAGSVFDGQYLYLVPQTSVVARFVDKSPPSFPPLPKFHGSFY